MNNDNNLGSPMVSNPNETPITPNIMPTGQETPTTQTTSPISEIQPTMNQPITETASQQNFTQPMNNQTMSVAQQTINQPTMPQQTVQESIPIQGTTNGQIDQTNVGFISKGEPIKKKANPGVVAVIVIAILAVLGCLGYFVGYPYLMKNFINTPKKIFDHTVDTIVKEVNTTLNDSLNSKMLLEGSFTLDTNMDALKDFNGYTISIRGGIDTEKETLEGALSLIEPSKKDHSIKVYLRNKKLYGRLSTSNDLFNIFDLTTDNIYNNIEPLFKNFKDNKLNNYSLIVNSTANSLKNTITKEKFTEEKDKINFQGKDLEVIKYSYVINKNEMLNIITNVAKGYANEDEIVTLLYDTLKTADESLTKENLKKFLNGETIEIAGEQKNLANSVKDFTEKDTMTFIIYTTGNKNEIVGFELKNAEEKITAYFNNNDEFEFKADETLIKGTKINNELNVSIIEKNTEYAKLVLKSWEINNFEGTYTILKNNELQIETDYTGTFKYVTENNTNSLKRIIDFSVNAGSEKISIKSTTLVDTNTDIANINENAAKNLDDETMLNELNKFIEDLSSTPLGNIINSLTSSLMASDPVEEEYYDDEYTEDLNF